MTVYQLLCCVRSPRWFNYQNPLQSEFDYFKDSVTQDLPQESVDSYLGRLISVALVLNSSIDKLDSLNFKYWLECLDVISCSGILSGHRPGKVMVEQIQQFLDYQFPPEWIKPLLDVFILQLHTRDGSNVDFNNPIFLDCLRKLHSVKFTPVVLWFSQNSHAVSSETLYNSEDLQ